VLLTRSPRRGTADDAASSAPSAASSGGAAMAPQRGPGGRRRRCGGTVRRSIQYERLNKVDEDTDAYARARCMWQ
jgi:hypothetical protein